MLARRKAHTAHEDSLPAIADQLHTEMGLKALQNIDVAKGQFMMDNKAIIQPQIETAATLEGRPSLFPFIEEFLKRKKMQSNIHEFLLNKKFTGLHYIDLNFLKNCGIKVEEAFKTQITQKREWI